MAKCHRILITGRVQGVFFRATTKEIATRLGLTGYVKNLPDGRVEILIQEDPGHLLDTLKQEFEISNIELAKSEGSFQTFEIIRQ